MVEEGALQQVQPIFSGLLSHAMHPCVVHKKVQGHPTRFERLHEFHVPRRTKPNPNVDTRRRSQDSMQLPCLSLHFDTPKSLWTLHCQQGTWLLRIRFLQTKVRRISIGHGEKGFIPVFAPVTTAVMPDRSVLSRAGSGTACRFAASEKLNDICGQRHGCKRSVLWTHELLFHAL